MQEDDVNWQKKVELLNLKKYKLVNSNKFKSSNPM
jgi:hypothetical protein